MPIGKIVSERASAKQWAHIYIEKEIHNRVNNLLNCIVYGRNRGVLPLQGGREPHCADPVRTPDDSNGKATSKWKCYDKVAVDLLKEYVRAFHRGEKKNHRLMVFQREKLPSGEKTAEGKEQRVKDTSECPNGRSVNRDGDHPMVALTELTDPSRLSPKQTSRHLTDNPNRRINTSVSLNHLQYVWLKHTMIIFKLLIGSNLKVEAKRKFEMTTTVLAVLKRTLRGMSRGGTEQARTRVDTLLCWAYLLSKIDMVDKELIIQMCHFFQNEVKTLSSANKFHLLSCMSSFHFLSKRFLRVGNYLRGYFFNLLRVERGRHAREGGEPTCAPVLPVNRSDQPAAAAAATPAASPAASPTCCASEVCQVLFKQKKHLSHLDRTILKNVLRAEVASYGKVTPPFFKLLVKLGDRELQRFLLDRIIEHVELYEQVELSSVLGSFVKREGKGKLAKGKLTKGEIHPEAGQAAGQEEELSTLVRILLEADLHSMNLKHVCYLYVYINRALKKELRRATCGRMGRAKQEEGCTQMGHPASEQGADANPFQPFEQICGGEDGPEGGPHSGGPYSGDPQTENIRLMNQVNEKIILTLAEKIYYLRVNNLVTLVYNTCPIISPKQAAFLELCFAHLLEENYLTFTLARVYRSLYRHFVGSGMCKSDGTSIVVGKGKGLNCLNCLNRAGSPYGEGANSTLAATSPYEHKMEKICSYLKERYYLRRDQHLGDISMCTILLNVCQKFLLELLVYSFHRSQGGGQSKWAEQPPGRGQPSCGGAAAVLELVQHIYTHLHFVVVSTREGVEGKGVQGDGDGGGYEDGVHCDGGGCDDEGERSPLRRDQLELALLYGRNIVSRMGVYVDSVERAFRFWGGADGGADEGVDSGVDSGATVGHLNVTPHGINQMNDTGGKSMPRGIPPDTAPQHTHHDLKNHPIEMQNVRHLMHYVSYVCRCISERMGKVEGEKIWGRGSADRKVHPVGKEERKVHPGVATPLPHQRVRKKENNLICV
ncbi:conserved Plasmodium protein, unknown function [Plasmodium vivax]|uniref:Uncharacterized protein n=1 Tax=Plasmodium vivax TaxID=5855 RepID=A0A1G4HIQ6_PLAVI|nr:conserved Plasmodium protein, unknown function [Plasmodium vivax]